MLIEGKDSINFHRVHGFERCTIYQTQIAAVGGENVVDGGLVLLFVNPGNFERRNNLVLEIPHKIQTQPVLHESKTLCKGIVVCDKRTIRLGKAVPQCNGSFMVIVPRAHQSIKRGGIYEDFFHVP